MGETPGLAPLQATSAETNIPPPNWAYGVMLPLLALYQENCAIANLERLDKTALQGLYGTAAELQAPLLFIGHERIGSPAGVENEYIQTFGDAVHNLLQSVDWLSSGKTANPLMKKLPISGFLKDMAEGGPDLLAKVYYANMVQYDVPPSLSSGQFHKRNHEWVTTVHQRTFTFSQRTSSKPAEGDLIATYLATSGEKEFRIAAYGDGKNNDWNLWAPSEPPQRCEEHLWRVEEASPMGPACNPQSRPKFCN
eukprot:Platyproteum_vivax@DN7125_c0_g2_i1.p1